MSSASMVMRPNAAVPVYEIDEAVEADRVLAVLRPVRSKLELASRRPGRP